MYNLRWNKIKVRSGSIEGFDNISRVLQEGVENSKKKFELIMKYSYPTLSKFKLLDFKVKVTKKSIHISFDKVPTNSIYYLAKKLLSNLFYRIVRSELISVGLEVS